MKKILVSLVAIFAIALAANAAEYTINDNAIDEMIENCIEVAAPVAMEAAAGSSATTVASAGQSPVVVILVNFFLGGFGIHRHLLGTRPFMWLIYTVTFGGIFGIVPLVDFIVEVVDLAEVGSLGRYEGNTSFFMWA